LWSCHHLLLDGWSLPLLIKEVFAFYEAGCAGQTPDPPRPRPYRDYIAWLRKQDLAQAADYWRGLLRGFKRPTPLAGEEQIRQTASEYAEERVLLSEEQTRQLQIFGREQQVTPSTVVAGAWAMLLSRHSGERDVVFGTTVSGRPAELAGVEQMLGLFINTLPVRIEVKQEDEIGRWLRQLQAQQVEMRQYEYSPLVEVQGWSDVPRGLPMFESIVVFDNYPRETSQLNLQSKLKIEVGPSSRLPHYPITITAWQGQQLTLRITVNRSRFDSSYLRLVAEDF